MAGLWMAGMMNVSDDIAAVREARVGQISQEIELQSKVKDLEERIGRLALLNQALWELLKSRLSLTEADLETLARDIDLRDGIADGRLTAIAVTCPTCKRINNSRHAKCLYCGQLFEKEMFA